MIDVPVLCLDPELPMPRRMRAGDAAADLPAQHDAVIGPGARALVGTGFAVALPPGMCGLVLSRSGLALNQGVAVLNAPGLIDSGYRGELQVVLHNTSDETVKIQRGQRIAQLLILPVPSVGFQAAHELPEPIDDRGDQGWGSSG